MASPHRRQHYCFPVDANVCADLTFTGGRVRPSHVRALRAYLATLERTLTEHGDLAAPAPEPVEPAAPGDLVQIRPTADPVFGGLMLRVTQTRDFGLAGYLLIPHRGGNREAWQRLKHCEYERVGRVEWPEAEWGFRSADRERRARMWSE